MKLHSSMKDLSKTTLSNSPALQESKLKKLISQSKARNIFNKTKSNFNNLEELQDIMSLIKIQVHSLRKIDPKLNEIRTNINDWLLAVIQKLDYGSSTYFLATDLIDKIVGKYDSGIEEMHMLSIASIFISSKYEEISPISLEQAAQNIGHEKFTEEYLRECELFILNAIKFKIPKNHFIDFTFTLINHLSTFNSLKPKKVLSESSLPSIFKYQYSPPRNNRNNQLNAANFTLNEGNEMTIKKITVPKSKFCFENIKFEPKFRTSINNAFINKVTENINTVNPDVEKEYENIVYLFSISIYKMIRLDYDLLRKTETLLLYFSILNFSVFQVNNFLKFYEKINLNVFFDFAENNGISKKKILVCTESINSAYKYNVLNKEKYKFLNELELVNFQN